MKCRRIWIVVASLALALVATSALGQDLDQGNQELLVRAMNESARLTINGYTAERVQAQLTNVCNVIDMFMSHRDYMYSAASRILDSGKFALSASEFQRVLSLEASHLLSLGVSIYAIYELRLMMWQLYYEFPYGIPLDLMTDDWFDTLDCKKDIASGPDPNTITDWAAIGRASTGVIVGLSSAVLDIPAIVIPLLRIAGTGSMVGGVVSALFAGYDLIESLR